MRKETAADRRAWTEHIDGKQPKRSKYNNRRVEFNGRMYDSQKEAGEAAKLQALEAAGKIRNLQYQVRIELIPKCGKQRAVVYVADFVYRDLNGFTHVSDAKGFKTREYKLKKRILEYYRNIEIEEL